MGGTERERGQTNSSIGQMYVSVSGLLGCPQAPQTHTLANLSGGGLSIIFLFFFFFCLHCPVKYLFICAANKTRARGIICIQTLSLLLIFCTRIENLIKAMDSGPQHIIQFLTDRISLVHAV